MKDTDDTIIPGRQATEDTKMAQVDAGLVPDSISVHVGSEAELEAAVQTLSTMTDALVFFRIPREVAERGGFGGREAAAFILRLPESVHGNVVMSFDGWADDPRELFEIPEIVSFCQGLIMGEAEHPGDMCPHARKLFSILMDEIAHAFDAEGNLVAPEWLEYAGQAWVIGVSAPKQCFVKTQGRIMRNIGFTVYLRSHILGERTLPSDA